uniref:Uncharacterized protein n=1 Tax=Setaria viridis TaxID=4556 RepID=A0A4U6TFN6_SETVI|nr:hypothetical protein SEVIR_8G070601v2 [Setaria viridis]
MDGGGWWEDAAPGLREGASAAGRGCGAAGGRRGAPGLQEAGGRAGRRAGMRRHRRMQGQGGRRCGTLGGRAGRLVGMRRRRRMLASREDAGLGGRRPQGMRRGWGGGVGEEPRGSAGKY